MDSNSGPVRTARFTNPQDRPWPPARVCQPRNHSWGRFPGNFSVGIRKAHVITRFLESPKNLGLGLGSGAAWAVIFDPLIFNIDPETKDLGHLKFHYVPSIAARAC